MPRAVALDLVQAVLRRRRPLEEAMEAHAGLALLAPRDRALARNIVATTLRRLGQIDALVDQALERPLPAKAAVARDLLRIGAGQVLFIGLAPHAAVDTAVALAEARRQGPYKRLVNAILRRLAREGGALIAAQDAARLNTPAWLWQRWSQAFGEGVARRIAEAHLAEPPLDLSVKADARSWAERLGAVRLASGGIRLGERTGRIEELPGFAEGAWWVQDAAAALPARLLGDVAGKRVIDLCAAPGGKTAQLAAAGARVVAVDRSPARMRRLEANLARLRLYAETVVADVETWRPGAPADAVLLDAPCTATGTIRRHPDVQHLKRPDDVAALARVQGRLISAALEMVRSGGLVVYCACSLEPEEGEAHAAALASQAGLEWMPIAAGEVGVAGAVTAQGALRTLPCMLAESGGMDGFFAARVRRA